MVEQLVPILRVKDALRSAKWYARLGFELTDEHRFGPKMPVYAFLERGDIHLHLSEHKGDARKGTLLYFWVDDVDAVAAEFGAPIEVAPWARECQLVDPDGNRLRVATRTVG